jgi:UDPglucose 6-dehydrogenase
VKDLASADKRVGRTHLDIWHKGSRGYGGKCLPKDTKALIKFSTDLGLDAKLLKTVEEINNTQLQCKK